MKKATSIVIGLAVVGGVVGLKFYNKGQTADDIKVKAVKFVKEFDGYAADPKYWDSLLEYAHPGAFDGSYTMGGRHTSPKFDMDKYKLVLLGKMADKAKKDGRQEVYEEIVAELRASSKAPK